LLWADGLALGASQMGFVWADGLALGASQVGLHLLFLYLYHLSAEAFSKDGAQNYLPPFLLPLG
jgi:hypothetical protein